MTTQDIDALLAEREATHVDFQQVAVVAQTLKNWFRAKSRHAQPATIEAFDMVAVKIARICSGDPNNVDHWKDISGYCTLALRELERDAPPQ